jgi:hypothetical protein
MKALMLAEILFNDEYQDDRAEISDLTTLKMHRNLIFVLTLSLRGSSDSPLAAAALRNPNVSVSWLLLGYLSIQRY